MIDFIYMKGARYRRHYSLFHYKWGTVTAVTAIEIVSEIAETIVIATNAPRDVIAIVSRTALMVVNAIIVN